MAFVASPNKSLVLQQIRTTARIFVLFRKVLHRALHMYRRAFGWFGQFQIFFSFIASRLYRNKYGELHRFSLRICEETADNDTD